MSKEKYLEELSDELKISKPMLKRFIHTVGTNKQNIKDYAENGRCAIVRKDNGFDVSYVAQMLNEKDAKIKDLEHRLSNCIEPKFKIGQEVWCIWGKSVGSFIVTRIDIDIKNCVLIGYGNRYLHQFEENCFATKEEAKAKLEEVKNGK